MCGLRFQHVERLAQLLVGMLALLITIGCNAVRIPESATSVPSPGEAEFNAWTDIAPGMQRRNLNLEPYSNGVMRLVRLDPAIVTFRVLYDPLSPHLLPVWMEREPDAALIVNGAFFNEERQALGLIISDGQVFGQTFTGFGGMFQVASNRVRVRSLVSDPYQGEPLVQAVQAFPLLIESGGVMAGRDEGFFTASRRTWIGQDSAGQIIIGVSHHTLTLAELQDILLNSALNLDIAFGLDGGRSSGMMIDVPGLDEHFPAFDLLPSVIAVYVP